MRVDHWTTNLVHLVAALKGKKPRLEAGLRDDGGAGIPRKPHRFTFAGQHVRIGAAGPFFWGILSRS